MPGRSPGHPRLGCGKDVDAQQLGYAELRSFEGPSRKHPAWNDKSPAMTNMWANYVGKRYGGQCLPPGNSAPRRHRRIVEKELRVAGARHDLLAVLYVLRLQALAHSPSRPEVFAVAWGRHQRRGEI